MKLVLFAQTSEAEATIAKLKAQPDPQSVRMIWSEGMVPTIYRFSGGTLVITDIGLHNAAAALARHGREHTEVWNVGFAGVLHSGLPIMELVRISRVGKFWPHSGLNQDSKKMVHHTLQPVEIYNEGYSLISSDVPIHEITKRQKLSDVGYDLVDMEGYAIAHLAHHLKIPINMYKIVSDYAQAGGIALIRKYAKDLSEKISQLFNQW